MPAIQCSRWLATAGQFIALRMDQKPFDDIRVRRALNLAVNKREIVKGLLLRRQRRDAGLSDAPHLHRLLRTAGPDARAGVKELYAFNPDRPRRCWPKPATRKGFTFRCRCASSASVEGPAADGGGLPRKVGVKMEIQTLEYAAFQSPMMTQHQRRRATSCTWAHQPDHGACKSFVRARCGTRCSSPTPRSTRRWPRPMPVRRARAPGRKVRLMTRQVLEKAPCWCCPAPGVRRLVALGEELRRRTARRRRTAGPDPRPHLGRPGQKKKMGF